jgi:hypothetical protein
MLLLFFLAAVTLGYLVYRRLLRREGKGATGIEAFADQL